MSNSYTRICFLLASSGLQEKELADFSMRIKEMALHEFLDDVRKKRALIISSSRESQRGEEYRTSRRENQEDYLSAKVSQLLLHEAGMTKSQASEALSLMLKGKGLDVPRLGKRGFSEWLKVLSQLLPPSELLHLSTRIRNQHVHQSDSDWSLK